jgi:rhodanese-related sulfurtransferase
VKKFLFILLVGVNVMMAQIKSVDDNELVELMKNGTVVIDIRREDEFVHYGIIEGSHTITFFDEMGNYDAQGFVDSLEKLLKNKDELFVILCAHANRTKVIGDFLQNQVGYTNVHELEGGINYGWLDKGKQTVRYK